MADVSSLYTIVKNIMNVTHAFGYLGYHGKTLASGATYSKFGSLIDQMASNRAIHKRWHDAITRDLLNGYLVIEQTPAPILHDTVLLSVKALSLNTGSLGVVDPSWGAYTGA